MKKFLKLLIWTSVSAVIIAAGTALFIWYCNYAVLQCSQHCIGNIDELPIFDTALLLGTAKTARSGNPNLYFSERIDTAEKLFKAGKIRHILISGDNSRKDYDEPTDMKNALLERGIPEEAMTLDYAGFRTLDSVVRAKTVFGKEKLLIITQNGHAERAVYIARKNGIDSAAFYAPEPIQYQWLVKRNRKREIFARIAAWLDVNILHRTPKFTK